MFKKIVVALGVLTLGACAAQNTALRESDLRKEVYLVGEYRIQGDLPQIQRNLYKHQLACGRAAQFRMDERQASYGILHYAREEGAGWDNTILIDLTTMNSGRTYAKAYSYRAGAKAEVKQILASINKPGECDPTAEPADTTAE